MKGSMMRMQEKIVEKQEKAVENILREKNRELRAEKERNQALEITNTIISAYLSILAEKLGTVRIPKKDVSLALGNLVTRACSEGDDYIITVEKISCPGECGGE